MCPTKIWARLDYFTVRLREFYMETDNNTKVVSTAKTYIISFRLESTKVQGNATGSTLKMCFQLHDRVPLFCQNVWHCRHLMPQNYLRVLFPYIHLWLFTSHYSTYVQKVIALELYFSVRGSNTLNMWRFINTMITPELGKWFLCSKIVLSNSRNLPSSWGL